MSNCAVSQSFKKSERLCGRDAFRSVFNNRNSIFVYPLTCFYALEEAENGSEVKIAVSVSKKKFKHAVDRNHIKRLVRESYRKQKHSLYFAFDKQNIALNLVFVYGETKHLPYKVYENCVNLLINKLIDKCQKKSEILKTKN